MPGTRRGTLLGALLAVFLLGGVAQAGDSKLFMPMVMKLGASPMPPATARPTASTGPTETPRPTGTASPSATATQGTDEPGGPVVPPPDAASARLQVPAGFAVRIYASGLQEPRL